MDGIAAFGPLLPQLLHRFRNACHCRMALPVSFAEQGSGAAKRELFRLIAIERDERLRASPDINRIDQFPSPCVLR